MISLYVIYPYIITPIAPTHILTLSLHDALPISQGMRNFSIALLAVPIPYTTNPGHIGIAFKGLGLPDKFAYAIDLSFRFLPDRKSTRLNSSHVAISYAVFCLKKKKIYDYLSLLL